MVDEIPQTSNKTDNNNGTRIVYYIDDEKTPYVVFVQKSPDIVTLADFKCALNKPNYKFFFKSVDNDIGCVQLLLFL
jgi:segment polarity protein dishevelled